MDINILDPQSSRSRLKTDGESAERIKKIQKIYEVNSKIKQHELQKQLSSNNVKEKH